MKRAALLLVLCVLAVTRLLDNPIFIPLVNEFVIAPGGAWTLELKLLRADSLKGWKIASKTDTTEFRSGQSLGPGLVVITRDSLVTPILFSRIADRILIINSWGLIEHFSYGDTGSESQIATPAFGQSICWASSRGYYLDNSPTLGLENDTSGAMGDLDGLVTDSLGTPIPSARITYHLYEEVCPVMYADESGRFQLHDLASRQYFIVGKSGYATLYPEIQLRPDSTVSMTVRLKSISTATNPTTPPTILSLSPNYPNPFNPSTTVAYSISRRARVLLTIAAVNGQTIAVLVNEMKEPGAHRVRFDGTGLASGIYFCRLETGTTTRPEPVEVRTVKMLLLK